MPRPLKICWIAFEPPLTKSDGRLTSNIASIRYRVLSPINCIEGKDIQNQLLILLPGTPDDKLQGAYTADAVVFSKCLTDADHNLAMRVAQKIVDKGIPLIFDICDNHFQHPDLGSYYRFMTKLATQVVCNTSEMSKIAQPYCSAPPITIEDPYEGVKGTPKFAPGETLKLLWFGHASNLDSFISSVGDLLQFAAQHPVDLTVLTQDNDLISQLNTKMGYQKGFSMNLKVWSIDAQWREIAACDAIIIPSLQNERKTVKSANRMIEGLWAGKPVAAQHMPAYLPFNQWTPVRMSISEGLRGLIEHQDKIPFLISKAQDYIGEKYSPAVLAQQWKQAILSQLKVPS